MKKISLDVDSLAVESFETAPADQRARGTVRANSYEDDFTRKADEPGTFFWPCEVSQGGTCDLSCWGGSCGLTCTCVCE